MPSRRYRTKYRLRKPSATFPVGDGGERAWCRHHTLSPAYRAIQTAPGPCNLSRQTAARASGHVLEQAPPSSGVCKGILRNVRTTHARCAPDFGPVGSRTASTSSQVRHHLQARAIACFGCRLSPHLRPSDRALTSACSNPRHGSTSAVTSPATSSADTSRRIPPRKADPAYHADGCHIDQTAAT
jgi:hypothetical protein